MLPKYKLLIAIPTIAKHNERLYFFVDKCLPNPTEKFHAMTFAKENQSLVEKTREICNSFLMSDSTHVLKIDTDSFLWLSRIEATEFYKYDYTGGCNMPPLSIEYPYFWAFGAGYFLSRRAAQLIVDEPNHGESYCEDRWVGRIMHKNGVGLNVSPLIVDGQERWSTEKYCIYHKHPLTGEFKPR